MLTLPIKRTWFDMILTGKKLEEYREVKPYYTARVRNCLGLTPRWTDTAVIEACRRSAGSGGLRAFGGIILRNGYKWNSPALQITKARIMIREGEPEWGAEPGKEYFVIRIEDFEILNPGMPKVVGGRKFDQMAGESELRRRNFHCV